MMCMIPEPASTTTNATAPVAFEPFEPFSQHNDSVTRSWAETVQAVVMEEAKEETDTQKKIKSYSHRHIPMKMIVTLQRVNPDLLVADFIAQLSVELQATTIRLIHKGKALSVATAFAPAPAR
jgi:hypothetical protein